MRKIILIFCALMSVAAFAAKVDEPPSYAAVSGTVTFSRDTHETNFPWKRAEWAREEREARKNHLVSIHVSNGGGLAEFTYFLLRIENTRNQQYWRARGELGEWGHVREYVFDTPYLIKYRSWHGVNYILESAHIYTDGLAQPFVAQLEFIDKAGWTRLIKPIDKSNTGGHCVNLNGDYEKQILAEGPTEIVDDLRCLTQGVYLRDIDPQIIANRRVDQ